VLSQMLRQNGGCHVVVAAPKGVYRPRTRPRFLLIQNASGLKMDLAKKLDSADVYIELSRTNPEEQFQKLKEENPYGFDIVVEVGKLSNSLLGRCVIE
jgi:D-arabinitol dehydrogenase (NADP+)